MLLSCPRAWNHVIGDFLGSWICLVISGGKAGFLGTALGSGHLRSLNPFSVMEMRAFLEPLLLFWFLVYCT